MCFDEQAIKELFEKVKNSMSPFRFSHTAEVEKMAARIAKIYAPEKIDILRAAALLHDITKELDAGAQAELLEGFGERISDADKASHKTLHARSAPYVIKRDYPEFATPELLDAVRYHTTGRENMTLSECIIFIADYIDMSRKFADCIYLRNMFWDAEPEKMNEDERLRHLYRTMLKAFDFTINALEKEGSPICDDSIMARDWLLRELEK